MCFFFLAQNGQLISGTDNGRFKIQGFKEKATGSWQLAAGDGGFKIQGFKEKATGNWLLAAGDSRIQRKGYCQQAASS